MTDQTGGDLPPQSDWAAAQAGAAPWFDRSADAEQRATMADLFALMNAVNAISDQLDGKLEGDIEPRLWTIEQQLAGGEPVNAISHRLTAIESRLDDSESRLYAIESRLETIDYRLETIERQLTGGG